MRKLNNKVDELYNEILNLKNNFQELKKRKENWNYSDDFNSNTYYKYIDCPICESIIFESGFKEHNYDEYIVEE